MSTSVPVGQCDLSFVDRYGTYTVCHAKVPADAHFEPYNGPWSCSLEKGHTGEHVAIRMPYGLILARYTDFISVAEGL